jgi:sigma-E factor negative regulatory protein RseC
MRDIGTIISLAGDKAQVRVTPQEGCSTCALKETCASGDNIPAIWALNPNNAKVGANVVVELKPTMKIFSAFSIYLIPILGLFLGYYLTDKIWGGKDYPVIGAVLGLIASIIMVKFIDTLYSKKRTMQPVISAILD